MPGPGRPYRLKKAESISRQRLGVQGGRSILAYGDLARRVAQGEMTKLIRGHRQVLAGIPEGVGSSLKNGVLEMGTTLGATDAQYAKLESMDKDVLNRMYNSNKLTFEVYFNYDGINQTKDGAQFVTEKKQKDLDWFINEYDRFVSAGL